MRYYPHAMGELCVCVLVYRARPFSPYARSGQGETRQEKGLAQVTFNWIQPTNQILLPRSGQLLIHEVSQLAVRGKFQHWQTSHRHEFNVTDMLLLSAWCVRFLVSLVSRIFTACSGHGY